MVVWVRFPRRIRALNPVVVVPVRHHSSSVVVPEPGPMPVQHSITTGAVANGVGKLIATLAVHSPATVGVI